MNRFGTLQKRCLIAVSAVIISVAVPLPASAEAKTPGSHCLLTVTGKDAKNIFTTAPERCFATFAEVLKAAGGQNIPDGITPALAKTVAVFSTTSIIGVHYDANNGTGASLTVNGTNCSGGGLNVPLAWNDRISSTINGCPTVVHYEVTNYAGGTYATYGVGTLSAIIGFMDNKTSSIKYF